ncbi:MAG: histidinol dehydrogenase [Desulfobacterales bacterium]
MLAIHNYPSPAAAAALERIVGRSLLFSRRETDRVGRILEDVRRRGDAALLDYTRRYDAPGFSPAQLVPGAEEEAAARRVGKAFRAALSRAAANIEAFHRRQLRPGFALAERPGTLLGQLVRPVERAGVYVPGGPGGTTPLVSSVLMGALPAKTAGVPEIVMVSPPRKDGRIDPRLLAAARAAGVTQVFKVGGPWAIGALAFGTETIPRVDVIVGPGNLYVTLAKRLVAGTVGIDLVAGPSELVVVADAAADPAFIAADLLAQAEHDALASVVLLTDRRELAVAVSAAMEGQLPRLGRAAIARRAVRDYGAALVTADLEAAFGVANRLAPEHLELHLEDPWAWLPRVRHAGAVFLGRWAPEAAGDYLAGPNHVLPTVGTARFASALSVDHFLKKTSLVYYAEEALRREAADIVRLAEAEGLEAHARSVRLRFPGGVGLRPVSARGRPAGGADSRARDARAAVRAARGRGGRRGS